MKSSELSSTPQSTQGPEQGQGAGCEQYDEKSRELKSTPQSSQAPEQAQGAGCAASGSGRPDRIEIPNETGSCSCKVAQAKPSRYRGLSRAHGVHEQSGWWTAARARSRGATAGFQNGGGANRRSPLLHR